ncbi:MAG: CPBP family intramembrane glutamic endopeptidase [Candidatus Limnocylindria bacterium]
MTGRLRGALAAMSAGPSWPADSGDRATVDVLGLRLPVRATVAIAVVTMVLLLDYSRTFLPADVVDLGRAPAAMLATSVERAILFGIVPLLTVLVAFRDRPVRYGLTLGDWRWGLGLMLAGCAVMTPIVLWFATLPDVRAYYGPSAAPLPELVLTNVLDLAAAEFAFRGFLLMTLLRIMGPVGVVVAALPFVFGHLGKPELELLSTLAGGLVYGWLAWRTRSIVWGAVGHTYILTLVTVAAAR